MKRILGVLVFSMLFSTASFAGSVTCYKMRLGNFQSVEAFEGNNFQYLCINRGAESSAVEIYSGTGRNTLVTRFLGCTEVETLPSYNANFYDDTATTIFNPNVLVCKHGLVIAYEKPENNDRATRLAMGGFRYSIAYTSFELPVGSLD